jgi:hypothetical protein
MVSVGSFGNMLFLFSVEILVKMMHNPFGDKLTVIIISVTLAILLVSLVLQKLEMICFKSKCKLGSISPFFIPAQ